MSRSRIPDRRERLPAAAHGLALERVRPATAVSGTAERTGIGKGAAYFEFPTKAAILDARLDQSEEHRS
ncbi:TetR family transcriptional regulator [Nocardiopsis composta]|uniref:AcrR family transcriptional regulator n=1 Tax=Nocardiopsis composta TaxID=157465 RepID=A0A7W8VFX6_9ACTN|nr:TetR family transcriptional regulator [Nocardiopsis composta]MBB5434575.1 AcrR family transcriptional regulator [Nocardiopsis composta]